MRETSKNSVDLARRIPAADLILYPDAAHGGIFQYHQAFVGRAGDFLATDRRGGKQDTLQALGEAQPRSSS